MLKQKNNMLKTNIYYGIDLGTTNSAISIMENGKPVITKTDTLKEIMPSCVYFKKNETIHVGDIAYSVMKREKLEAMKNFDLPVSNSFFGFKRTIGTGNKYFSSNTDKEFTSVELHAEVLKALKSFISNENFKSVVITIPAKTNIVQREAFLRAAKLAGFEQCILLPEPIAASLAYGLDKKNNNGYWLVFDFGGASFDATLMIVEDGNMHLIAIDGDFNLGGETLDYAIVDKIIIPYLMENFKISRILVDNNKKKILKDAMKFYAEETKTKMSFNDKYKILTDIGEIPGTDDNGKKFNLDITVTQEMMQKTLGPLFQKAITISNHLLRVNDMDSNDLDGLILVGGPTYSPILRRMLEEQIIKPDTSINPMTIVSKGAALYASSFYV